MTVGGDGHAFPRRRFPPSPRGPTSGRCGAGSATRPSSGVFALSAVPWTPADLATCPLSDLPTAGKLSGARCC